MWEVFGAAGGGFALTFIVLVAVAVFSLGVLYIASAMVVLERFARGASRATLGFAIVGAMPVAGFAQSAESESRPWYERIEFGGDFRSRYEGFYQDGRTTRHRSRLSNPRIPRTARRPGSPAFR